VPIGPKGQTRPVNVAIIPEDLANLRRQWFKSVYEIADMEYQRRTWLTPPTDSPHWSFVEFCCSYPDAGQIQFARDRGHLSAKEFELLASLHEALISYQAPGLNDYDSRAVLEDPAWQAVVAKAERIRQQLLTLTVDPIERSYLMGQIGTQEPHIAGSTYQSGA
jgi:hypothetical protein